MRVITVLEAYRKHVAERAAQGIVPQPLNAEQTAGLIELLKNPRRRRSLSARSDHQRVPPGVDEAAYVKAGFLSAIAKGEATSPLIRHSSAVELLGTMQGGYNIATWSNCSTTANWLPQAAEQLKHTLLMFDAFHDVAEEAKNGNDHAKAVMQSWADGEWFTNRPTWPTRSAARVQGHRRNQHRRPVPGARRLVAP